jgi:hypothetical protein
MRPNVIRPKFLDISDMAGKYRWCMIFLRLMIHKWGALKLAESHPEQAP